MRRRLQVCRTCILKSWVLPYLVETHPLNPKPLLKGCCFLWPTGFHRSSLPRKGWGPAIGPELDGKLTSLNKEKLKKPWNALRTPLFDTEKIHCLVENCLQTHLSNYLARWAPAQLVQWWSSVHIFWAQLCLLRLSTSSTWAADQQASRENHIISNHSSHRIIGPCALEGSCAWAEMGSLQWAMYILFGTDRRHIEKANRLCCLFQAPCTNSKS